jgi:hypothetical protein
MNRTRINISLIGLALFWGIFLMSVIIKAQSWEELVTDKGIKIIDHFPLPESYSPDKIASHSAASINEAAIVPLSETFKLHSQPNATKVVYLDFDGHEGLDGTYSPLIWMAVKILFPMRN